jgi:hypothetical protein
MQPWLEIRHTVLGLYATEISRLQGGAAEPPLIFSTNFSLKCPKMFYDLHESSEEAAPS